MRIPVSSDAVEPLGARLADDLRAGRADAAPLRRVGAAEPEKALAELQAASGDPDLADCVHDWAPALLKSARPELGARTLAALARACRDTGRRLEVARAPHLPRLLGTSAFLGRLLLRRPDWWTLACGDPPEAPGTTALPPSWDSIREEKYRALLRIATRDLAGRPFEQSLAELSLLADRCLAAALTCAAAEQGTSTPALFALGKLGGNELNFSSDVDLLFLHETDGAGDPHVVHEQVVRLVRRFKRGLEERTADGFGYRVDLDLRPEGRGGVLANTVNGALDYYESFGAEWERQMLIRLRPVAGDPHARERFTESIRPFVYRRLIDPGVLGSVRAMKEQIERERLAAGRDLQADLKEGPGGIRDIEFLAQALQLFHGARHPALRTGNVLASLEALGAAELLPAAAVADLRGDYLWLRRAEHALQMAEERQTARFPADPAERLALARSMGYADADGSDALAALCGDRERVTRTVRAHFHALILQAKHGD